jgi:hypothetical protein
MTEANDMRGEVLVTIGTGTYTLRYTTGALRRLEKTVGHTIPQLLSGMNTGKFGYDLALSALEAGLSKEALEAIGPIDDAITPLEVPAIINTVVRALVLSLSGPEALAKMDALIEAKKAKGSAPVDAAGNP